VAFQPDSGLIILPAVLWGPRGDTSLRLVLDTGAAGTTVCSHALTWIGYDPAVARERVQLTTASGVVFAPRIRVQKIEALGKARQDFPVVCHTLPPSAGVDGVLGLDFFRGQRLVMDFREGVVSLD
jgi:predicted aspartyl protease